MEIMIQFVKSSETNASVEKSDLQDTASLCNAQLYMTYSKCLEINGLAGNLTLSKIKKTASELGVSEDLIICAWLEEMSSLHK